METRHPVERSLVVNLRRSIIIAESWRPRKTLKIFFLRFFWKNDLLRENFQNSVPKEFIATPIDALCLNLVKFGRWQKRKVVRYLPDKKKQNFVWLSSRYCADRAQNLPRPVFENVLSGLDFIQIWVIPERVNTFKTRGKVNPIFGWSVASRQIMMELHRNLEKFVGIIYKLRQNPVKFTAFAVPTLPQRGWGWILAGWIDRMVRLAGWVGLNPIIVMSPQFTFATA